MDNVAITSTDTNITGQFTHEPHQSQPLGQYEKIQESLREYWRSEPELARMVQLKKEMLAKKNLPAKPANNITPKDTIATEAELPRSFFSGELRGIKLRKQLQVNHRVIREYNATLDAKIIPRTEASNKKNTHKTVEDEINFRSELVLEQIKAWRHLIPILISQLRKIRDPRSTKNVKHKLTVLMLFGLFAFVFQLSSRREMNRELTGPLIFEHLQKLFPEIDSIPHADTLARLLEKIKPKDIEAVHINLIRSLIKKKKFKKLLINGCLPITIDGTQKLYRDGLLQDSIWCERKVGNPEDSNKQQYIYALEANITLKNGLTIPFMTEYLYHENNELLNPDDKQDCETKAFERMAERMKEYFPRLKMIFFSDAMFANQTIMGILHKNRWEYILRFEKKQLTTFAEMLSANKKMGVQIPNQPAYRNREQTFHWQNNIYHGYEWQLNINLVSCVEKYYEANKKTGGIDKKYSERSWISSIPIHIMNVYELLNLGARKKELIEDSHNTEKNRGYSYKNAFSYNWNAMQGFHYLMRLAHAINAMSEFTKKLKQYVKTLGSSATLKLIKETLFSPWLPMQWYDDLEIKPLQLRFQLE